MKVVTNKNFRRDPLFPKVEKAVSRILSRSNVITPLDVFTEMQLIRPVQIRDWRTGKVEYLERVIICNLSKIERTLRILKLHAQACNLRASETVYMVWRKGKKARLRFTKTSNPRLEASWSTHFLSPKLKPKQESRNERNGLTR